MIGDLDRRAPEIDPNGPPLEWFEGIGTVDFGIRTVHYSDELLQMGEGLEEQLTQWGHLTGNVWIGEGDNRRQIRDASEAPQEWQREKMQTAERIVLAATGFTPAQIQARRMELHKIFRRQRQAPFHVVLDIPEVPRTE